MSDIPWTMMAKAIVVGRDGRGKCLVRPGDKLYTRPDGKLDKWRGPTRRRPTGIALEQVLPGYESVISITL